MRKHLDKAVPPIIASQSLFDGKMYPLMTGISSMPDRCYRVLFFYILAFAACIFGHGLSASAQSTVRLEPTRDTWLSNAGQERSGANGGAPRLKLKSIQELSLIDFPWEKLKSKKLSKAYLYLKQASQDKVDRITISTLAQDWVEGTSQNYAIVDGQSTFSHRVYPNEKWGDNDVTAVALGAGSTQWQSLAPEVLAEDWIRFDVPIALIEPCVAGLSPGWLLMDDTGSTWKRDGESFTSQLFPNRLVFSKDSNRASAPYLVVETQPETIGSSRPIAPTKLAWKEPSTTDPRFVLTWYADPTAIVGHRIYADNQLLSQIYLPSKDKVRDGVWEMTIDPLLPPWDLSRSVSVSIETVDRMGNSSQKVSLNWAANQNLTAATSNEAIASFLSSKKKLQNTLVQESADKDSIADTKSLTWKDAARWGTTRVAIVDPLDVFNSTGSQLVPIQRSNYLTENALWNASESKVTLHASRGEWVGFQIAIQSPPKDLQLQWNWEQPQSLEGSVYRYEYVPVGNDWIADPLVPIGDHRTLANGIRVSRSPNAKDFASWLIEIYVPHEHLPGLLRGSLRLVGTDNPKQTGADDYVISLSMNIDEGSLPRELHFLPEMNCYDLPNNERDYYRLANRHRVVVNRVPYYQNGRLASGLAPTLPANFKGDESDPEWDWTNWDQRFGDYFSGQAFADLPRGKTPIECFYFPMHENWPMPIDANYNGSYWADEAFSESYRNAWIDAVAKFSRHVEERGWKETRFHVFLNNKVDFKKRGWSRGSSPWLLDEPANHQDYVALRYFGNAYREGLMRSGSSARVLYRCDISRPQWQRTTLDGLLRYNVVSQGAFREYRRTVLDRKFRDDQTILIYGSSNPIGSNNVQAVAWAWDSFLRGADGVLPWQTIGNADSWKKGDELSLFYPAPTIEQNGFQTEFQGGAYSPKSPIPSIRLKAYCYGQQDVERMLHCWIRDSGVAHNTANTSVLTQGIDRYRWGEQVLAKLGLESKSRASGDYVEDTGWADYGSLTPEMFELWRREWRRENR